jgi:hypothetical protein
MNNRKPWITISDIKAVVSYLLLATILFGPFLLLFGFAGYIESHYTVDATIVEIEDNVYTVEYPNGHQFQFTLDEYEVGDEVKLYMDNNHTDGSSDDTIYKVKINEDTVVDMR